MFFFSYICSSFLFLQASFDVCSFVYTLQRLFFFFAIPLFLIILLYLLFSFSFSYAFPSSSFYLHTFHFLHSLPSYHTFPFTIILPSFSSPSNPAPLYTPILLSLFSSSCSFPSSLSSSHSFLWLPPRESPHAFPLDLILANSASLVRERSSRETNLQGRGRRGRTESFEVSGRVEGR